MDAEELQMAFNVLAQTSRKLLRLRQDLLSAFFFCRTGRLVMTMFETALNFSVNQNRLLLFTTSEN